MEMEDLENDRDPSEDFNPATANGRDISPNRVHRVQSKKIKKKPHLQKQNRNPPNNRKEVSRQSINSEHSLRTNDSNSVSTFESSINSSTSANNIVKNHLLFDKADPPANAHCSVIKLLCYHYSIIREKKFAATNLKEELQRIHKEGNHINWTGTDGVSQFCNEMKPKHFGKLYLQMQ